MSGAAPLKWQQKGISPHSTAVRGWIAVVTGPPQNVEPRETPAPGLEGPQGCIPPGQKRAEVAGAPCPWGESLPAHHEDV